MSASKVYYTSMRTAPDDSIPAKLARLVKAAGLGGDVDVTDKLVGIKAHFGEYGNVSFLKPAYLRTIAQEVKAAGGKPFATDCSTLYVGMRNNALEHLECAAMNGFNRDSIGCEIVISDGDKRCLEREDLSLNAWSGYGVQTPVTADVAVSDGDRLPFGGGEIEVLSTPGHTRGGVCYLFEDCLFSGDTLFRDSCGRTDFPGSSTDDMLRSLKRLAQLPGDCEVYPGHGFSTTLDWERSVNYFIGAALRQ